MNSENDLNARIVYADIIDLPHWDSPKHPRMSLQDRAAQFAPYSAVVGYGDMIKEEARETGTFEELSEDESEELSEEERKVAIEILKQYAQEGNSSLLKELKYADFEEIPVDIHTFLHDKKYLGNALYDQDGRFTLFPY